jgi:hypothetical protein
MIRIRVGGLATTAIGAIYAAGWAVYGAGDAGIEGFTTGLAVATAGAAITGLASWMENTK